MTLSEVIQALQTLLEEVGDIEMSLKVGYGDDKITISNYDNE